jgi:uncharacterized protein YhaN
MDTMEDASMLEVETIDIDFSEGALAWLQANHQKLEDMVQKNQTMYNLEEWELFERWANNESKKLQAAKAQQERMEREVQKMKIERTQMLARIAHLEQGDTFSSVPQDYRTGMIAIERLVCSATRADEQILQPARDEERILDRLDKLVGCMADMEKRRMEARE